MRGGNNAKTIKDHDGTEFRSISEMLRYHGISPGTYYDRLSQGLTPEQAVSLGDGRFEPATDHLGNKFRSKTAMAKAYGISYNTFNSRIARGLSLKDALTGGRKPVRDHLGKTYPTMTAMAQAYKISRNVLDHRLSMGWDMESALTVKPGARNSKAIAIKDHTGREFPSMNAMYAWWGITKSRYYNRIKAGMDMKAALETPPSEGESCQDHDGKIFPSLSAMCRHHGVSMKSFLEKRAAGMTMQQALSKSRDLRTPCEDWSGKKFRSVTELADALHVPASNLLYYMKHRKPGQADQEIAAKSVSLHWPGTHAEKYYITRCLGFPWFLCTEKNSGPEQHLNDVILHADRILALKSQK